tara:strand:- start:494 stop:1444 length:951 start_codon:yes stop_codon:yes gene_type:complete
MSAIKSINRATSLLVRELSVKYGFDHDEAMEYLVGNTEKKAPAAKTKKEVGDKPRKGRARRIPLPWTGVVNQENCCALSYNLGLFTQCENTRKDGGMWCEVCMKKNEEHHGFPYGTVEDRLKPEFKGAGGKPLVHYGNIIDKKNIEKQAVLNYAREMNIAIPDEMFEVIKKPRGRPKKVQSTVVDDTSSEDDKPKKRGRPAGKKAVVVDTNSGTLLGNIIHGNTNTETKQEAPSGISIDEEHQEMQKGKSVNEVGNDDNDDSDDSDDSDDDDATEAVEFIHDGVKYWKTNDNELYDPETQNHICNWDPETKNIIAL